MKREISIYVHIPFCEKKCNYCAFNSFCAGGDEIENYINVLCEEIKNRSVNFNAAQVKTIYFGGGTPSILTAEQFEKIVSTIFASFDVKSDAEFTVEMNPNSITQQLLATYKKLRVNRISVGVQSLSDKSLQRIGRLHDRKTALEKIKLARKTFANVSADLIVGLQDEDGKTLCRYARELLALGVKHISCYLLEIYPNTPIFEMIKRGKFVPLDDEQTISAFEKLSSYLQDAGFERYEISNIALPGFESKHNLNYWARGEYLGFGLSAHSFVGNVRRENAGKMDDYVKGKFSSEVLTEQEENEEKIMLGLRCKLGVNLKDLKNCDLTQNPSFKDFLSQGILKQSGDVVTLNPLFYHVSNSIISSLI